MMIGRSMGRWTQRGRRGDLAREQRLRPLPRAWLERLSSYGRRAGRGESRERLASLSSPGGLRPRRVGCGRGGIRAADLVEADVDPPFLGVDPPVLGHDPPHPLHLILRADLNESVRGRPGPAPADFRIVPGHQYDLRLA